jgi:hypothetical protein
MVQNPVLLMICGALIGFVLAYLIFFFEELPGVPGPSFSPQGNIKDTKGILTYHPKLFTWIMLFIIHTGMATALGLGAFQMLKLNILSKFTLKPFEITVSAVLVGAMILVSSASYILPFESGNYYHWPRLPLNNLWFKVILLLAISIFSAGLGVLGLIFIGCYCRKLILEQLPENAIELYNELKDYMERLLLIVGLILSVGVVTVYFFNAAIAEQNGPAQFGAHGVAIFGLLFTVFIAVSFIPTRILLADLGKKIIESRLSSNHELATTDLKTWVETRKELEYYLEIKLNWLETLKYVVPVLGPIISSLLPNAFEIIK